MLTKSKVRAAFVTGVAFLSITAATSWAGAEAGHRAQQRARPADTRSRSALLAQCRVEKSGGVDSGACDALDTSRTGLAPGSTPALSALLQQCLAAKAGHPGASPNACAALDRDSGN